MSKQIVRYKLKFIDGVGHQPYCDIAGKNCEFEGGSYGTIDGFMIGYVTGETEDILRAIDFCSDYRMTALSDQDALVIADLNNPPNHQNEYGKYLQPATIVDGKISQVYADTASVNPGINLVQYYKNIALTELMTTQGVTQAAGITCSNGIKLQVDETSLIRWTQLMTGLAAFQPAMVSIRDYNNVVHDVSLAVAIQMLAEVFLWGQVFLADTWSKKDIINAG
jgi:hypothetical protein